MANLAGLHDLSAAKIAPPGTWVLDTVALSSIPSAPVYPASLNMIARLNWGYRSTGTLPVPDQYPDFARRVANYVRMAHGCSRWVIGNEPNHPQEWPNGEPIYPAQYAACYRLCREAIHAIPGREQDEVLLAGSGPWNAQLKYTGNANGDWIQYFADVIGALGGEVDGFSVHSYTHGYNVALVTSSARMEEPFQNRRSEFRTYLDYLEAIPDALAHLPVYITEANGNGPWQAAGLMPAMLNEVDNYNHTGKFQVRCVVFYRFSTDDTYNIDGKDDVIKEYQAAVERGYPSPNPLSTLPGVPQVPNSTFIPIVSTGSPASALPQRDISADFKKRVPTINLVADDDPRPYYRLVKAEYHPDGAKVFGPDHHILVEVLDENGKRQMGKEVTFWWGSGAINKPTDKTGGPYAVDYDMPDDGYSYGCKIKDDLGDSAFGMGLGTIEQPNWKIHVTYYLVFQRVIPVAQSQPTVPAAPTVTQYVQVPLGANLRDAPVTGTVLIAVPFGESVQVSGEQLVDTVAWSRSSYQGKSGWILASYLSENKPAPLPVGPAAPPTTPVSGTLDPLILEAIVLTESGGSGFQNGRLVVRLEAHLLLNPTYGNPALLTPYFKYNAANILEAYWRNDPNGPWQPLHASQDSEWAAFTFASRIDAQAALRCISMGAGQVMGFNAKRVGYASPLAMFNACQRSQIAQVTALINYCLSSPALVQAIAAKDFKAIATLYNGAGNEATYVPLLMANYQKVSGM